MLGRLHIMPAMRGLVVVLCLVVSMQVDLCAAAAAAVVPAIYVFGDSTLDVGNNNYLTGADVPRANKPYYGIDFPGSAPTGRFSNGYNIADYVAKNLGFNSSPPAYLSLAPRTGLLVETALSTGVSYASAGAGILNSTNAGNVIPLSKQVEYFRATKSGMVTERGSAAVDRLLARSVFLIGVGSNDLFVFAQSAAGPKSDVAALYRSLISNYTAAIKELHTLGARKLAIINVGMLGCVPASRLLSKTGACEAGLNKLAAGFNAALAPAIAALNELPSGFTYSLADIYGLTEASFADPGAAGYTDVAAACCGAGRLLAEEWCQHNSTVCADRDRLAFWDRVHPSQRAAMLSAMHFYGSRPGRFTTPIDFKGLAEAN